jgi:vancomycin resistance protein VanJ
MLQPIRPSRFRRVIDLTASLYLLNILIYLLARVVIQDRFWLLGLVNSFAYLVFLPLMILLPLALVTRSRRALISLLPIIFLLVIWFGPRFLPKSIPAEDRPTLRVLTNNVWRLNPTPEAVVGLITEQKPDVVFLQEVHLATQGEALATLDAEYPYQSQLIDELRLAMYEGSNITLSRYPLVESEKIELGLITLPVIYRDVIDFDGQRIALYNIHLMTPIGGTRANISDNYFAKVALGYDDSARNRQIEVLLDYLANEPYPYIAAGDFNTSDLSMTYTTLTARMRDSFGEAGIGLGHTWPAGEALALPSFLPPLVRMDYIWHSAGLQTVRAWQGAFVGGDHLPVLADIRISQ